MMFRNPVFVGAAVLSLGLAAESFGVTIPYLEDFDAATEGLHESKSNTAASTWTLTNSAYQHTLAAPGSGVKQFAGAVVWGNGMEIPSDFMVQTTFNVSDVSSTASASVAKVGLVGLALDQNVLSEWNSNARYYVGELVVAGNGAGQLRISYGRGQNSAGTLAGTTGTGGVVTLPDFQLNTTYTMSFVGDFDNDGNLTLSFKVDDTTLTAATILAADVLDINPYFGIRDYVDNARNLTVTYDNLFITNVIPVPEPASLALTGLGSLLLVPHRRRG